MLPVFLEGCGSGTGLGTDNTRVCMLPIFLGGMGNPKPLICNGSNSRRTISDSKVICKIGINKF
jgi:hypothetical protein